MINLIFFIKLCNRMKYNFRWASAESEEHQQFRKPTEQTQLCSAPFVVSHFSENYNISSLAEFSKVISGNRWVEQQRQNDHHQGFLRFLRKSQELFLILAMSFTRSSQRKEIELTTEIQRILFKWLRGMDSFGNLLNNILSITHSS